MKTHIKTPMAIKNVDLAIDYQSHGKRMFQLGFLAGTGAGLAIIMFTFWIASLIVI